MLLLPLGTIMLTIGKNDKKMQDITLLTRHAHTPSAYYCI